MYGPENGSFGHPCSHSACAPTALIHPDQCRPAVDVFLGEQKALDRTRSPQWGKSTEVRAEAAGCEALLVSRLGRTISKTSDPYEITNQGRCWRTCDNGDRFYAGRCRSWSDRDEDGEEGSSYAHWGPFRQEEWRGREYLTKPRITKKQPTRGEASPYL